MLERDDSQAKLPVHTRHGCLAGKGTARVRCRLRRFSPGDSRGAEAEQAAREPPRHGRSAPPITGTARASIAPRGPCEARDSGGEERSSLHSTAAEPGGAPNSCQMLQRTWSGEVRDRPDGARPGVRPCRRKHSANDEVALARRVVTIDVSYTFPRIRRPNAYRYHRM
jgi:hypothetical protein